MMVTVQLNGRNLHSAGDVRAYLKGRTALVTGSSLGIGNALARALVDAGATVVLNGINPERLKFAEAALAAESLPGRIHSCAFDVTSDAEAIAAVEADVVIESSGSHHGLASAIKGAVRGGKVVMVGLLPSGPQPVLISLAITRELELLGSFRFNDEIADVISALADGSLVVDPVVTHTFALENGLEAFEVAKNSALAGKVLLDFRQSPA